MDIITTARQEALTFKFGREYLEKEGFCELFPPKIVRASGACENVDTLFEVAVDKNFNWFGKPRTYQAYLSQTGQLYLEAFVPYLKKTYCVGPSFRAEVGADDRHMTEFTMVEIEFEGNFDNLLKHIEGFIYHIAQNLKKGKNLKPVFPKITYDEAIKILGLEWGDDISSKNEAILIRKFNDHPLFITHYPDPLWDHGREIEVEKFFNMLPDPDWPGRVLSADLILPTAGEAVGAAARVHDPDVLISRLTHSRMFKRLKERGGDLDDFSWYIKRIKEKTVPHAGCGFGMARVLRWLHNAPSIHKAVVFSQNQTRLI